MAQAADRFKFRPSTALGIENNTQALLFDIIAATIVIEKEAGSYRGAGKKGLDPTLMRKANDRFEAQEKKRLENA